MKTESRKRLLEEFAPPAPGQWRAEAEKLLKGVPFEKKMLTRLPEGITLQPIYETAPQEFCRDLPGQGSRVRGGKASGYLAEGWRVSQELPYGLPEEFNEAARHDVARGQTEVHLILDAAGRAGRDPDDAGPGEVGACGTSISTVRDVTVALRELDWSKVSLCVAPGANGLAVGMLLRGWAERVGVDRAKLRGAVLFDPVSEYARTGKVPVAVEWLLEEVATLAGAMAKEFPGMRSVGVDAMVVHEAGGHGVQELAYAVALGTMYVRELVKRGMTPEGAAKALQFGFAVGPNFFAEMAKLRAARILWTRVVEVFGVDPKAAPMAIHARTALRDKTRLDPYTNMLRTTTEAMSAVLGGCTSLHVGPYDEVFQVPDGFSRRIARNTQIILDEECGLGRVIDPAGGSWFVESLTAELAERAWKQFQEMERAGGLLAVLRGGGFQREVAGAAEERAKALGTRRETMIGVNNFPNSRDEFGPDRIPDYKAIRERRAREVARRRTSGEPADDRVVLEALGQVADTGWEGRFAAGVAAALHGATLGELTRAFRAGAPAGEAIEAMPMRRTAWMYEVLRMAAARAKAAGQGPRLLQVNLGPSRTYRARADWTTNFFQVAGIEVDAAREFTEVEEAVEAVREARVRVVVMCGTDESYRSWVPELARRCKGLESAPKVIVAGAPGELEAEWRGAGVDDFVHVRVPHHAFVTGLLREMGVLPDEHHT